MKKLLCAVLPLLLLVSSMSVYAVAASEEALQEIPAGEEMNASDAEQAETEETDAAELSLDGAPGQLSTFATMDELKTLINTVGERMQAYYSGMDTFVFNESISLPSGLSISFNGMDVEIASGVQVINNNGFYDCGELTVNGVLINTGSVDVASLTGVANVTNSGNEFVVGCTVGTAAALASALNGAASASDAYLAKKITAKYTVFSESAVVLEQSITVPSCATLRIETDTTISSGCTLTNNGLIELTKEMGAGKKLVLDGGAYAGPGGIQLRKMSSYLTDKDAALEQLVGFDEEKLRLDETTSTWYYSALTELPAPTGLVFDNGYATWTDDGAAENTYLVKFYLQGEEEPIASSLTTECSAFILSAELPTTGQLLGIIESGEYYFTVSSIGDFVSTASSAAVQSDSWEYSKPEPEIGICTDVTLDQPTLTFTAPQDASKVLGYEVEVTTSPEEAMSLYDVYTRYVTATTASLNDVIAEYSVGYYRVRVRALSSDPAEVLSSDWSEYSGIEYYGMADLLSGLADRETLPAEIRTTLQKAAVSYASAAGNPEGKTLEGLLLEDEDVLADVETIDSALGGVKVVVGKSISSEIDQSQVKIVGGAINTPVDEDTQISLEIGAAAKDNDAPAMLERALTVQFSMTMGNIENAEDLEFPVWVRLPIPKTMDPEDLVILHYHVNGDVEEVEYTLIKGEDDQYYAAFVLKDFSDFSIAGSMLDGVELPGDVNGDGKVNASDLVAMMKYLSGYELYVKLGALDVSGDGETDLLDLVALMKALAERENEA